MVWAKNNKVRGVAEHTFGSCSCKDAKFVSSTRDFEVALSAHSFISRFSFNTSRAVPSPTIYTNSVQLLPDHLPRFR